MVITVLSTECVLNIMVFLAIFATNGFSQFTDIFSATAASGAFTASAAFAASAASAAFTASGAFTASAAFAGSLIGD